MKPCWDWMGLGVLALPFKPRGCSTVRSIRLSGSNRGPACVPGLDQFSVLVGPSSPQLRSTRGCCLPSPPELVLKSLCPPRLTGTFAALRAGIQ